MKHPQRSALRRLIQLLSLCAALLLAGPALAGFPPTQPVLMVCDQAACDNPHETSYRERLQMAGYMVETVGSYDITPGMDLSTYSFVYAGFFWAKPDDPRVDHLIDSVVSNGIPLLATDPALAVQWGLANNPPPVSSDIPPGLASVFFADQAEVEIIDPTHPLFVHLVPSPMENELLPVYRAGDPAMGDYPFIGVLDGPSLSYDAWPLARVYDPMTRMPAAAIVEFPAGAMTYSGAHASPTAPYIHLGMGNEVMSNEHENFWQIFLAAAEYLSGAPGGGGLDWTPPVTSIDLNGTPGAGGSYASAVKVTLLAADEPGGSGVMATEYSLDGGAWTPYSAPFSVFRAGLTSVRFRSMDMAGNWEPERERTIVIDLDLPGLPPRDFLFAWGSLGEAPGQFNLPSGIAVDSGELYVADDYNSRIQVFDAAGSLLRHWGSYGAGSGEFHFPTGVAVSADGRVYVVEAGNHRVQVFDRAGNFLGKWGSYGTAPGQLIHPDGIAVDGAGKVYVANHDGTIHVFGATGNFLRKLGGQGSGPGQLASPFGIAVDEQGLVYVVEQHNYRVSVFDAEGRFVNNWGSQGAGDGQFAGVSRGIAIDGHGYVYVADHTRIQVFDKLGHFVAKWGSYGSGDGQFRIPHGIAVDRELDRVYVADNNNHRIQVFGERLACAVSADAGSDLLLEQTMPAGAVVILDGSLSASACGEALEYDWNWSGGSAFGAAPTVTLPAGTTVVTLTVRGRGGEQASDAVQVTVVDSVVPVTALDLPAAGGAAGWHVAPVTALLSAADAGSGVAAVRYRVDGGAEVAVDGSFAEVLLDSDGVHTLQYRAEDLAGNLEAERSATVRIDATPPELAVAGVADGASYLLGAVPAAGYEAADALSGLGQVEEFPAGAGPGSHTYRVVAYDCAGNRAEVAADYRVVYAFGGFLPPLEQGKPLKLGRTVPVKFVLADALGVPAADARATLRLQQLSGDEPVGEPVEPEAAEGADSGTLFRYDADAGHYIYNLRTGDGLSVGTWQLQVMPGDGTVRTAVLQLK